jgi:hypothetical protein
MAQAFVNVGVASNDGVAVNGIDKRTVFAYVGVVSLFAHENKMLRFNAKLCLFENVPARASSASRFPTAFS